jgi:hypothetical protein
MDFNEVQSYPAGQERDRLPMTFTSKSGFPRAPRIFSETQESPRWEWNGDANVKDQRAGFILFDPPLKNENISFTMETETYNAFHFNQRDRLDAAASVEESVSFNPENLYDSYVIRVKFPSRHFPKEFKLQAINEFKRRNHKEEKLIQPGFKSVASESMVELTLEKPLTGYSYRIVWTLPENDIDEFGYSGRTALVVRETIKRLANLASDSGKTEVVRRHLDGLREQFATAKFGPDAIDDAGLEVALHVFCDEKHGLIVVASDDTDVANVITVGRTTVGQAYRRRSLVSWVLNTDSDDSNFWDYGNGHRGIISVPLFYPVAAGIRTCVLSIATKSAKSGLLKIISKLHDRDIRQVFLQHINAWYATSLAGALGLPDLRPDLRDESQPASSHSEDK